MNQEIRDFFSQCGKKGGEAGKGASKRRTKAQYRAAGKKSGEIRRAKRDARLISETTDK